MNVFVNLMFYFFFFFKQKTAYEIRPCDWSSDVCSSDLARRHCRHQHRGGQRITAPRCVAPGPLERRDPVSGGTTRQRDRHGLEGTLLCFGESPNPFSDALEAAAIT